MTLSDKITKSDYSGYDNDVLYSNDVKEFIDTLCMRIETLEFELDPKKLHWEDAVELIKEEAGDKLCS